MSALTPINISIFNVNGLGQEIKRLAIFNKLKYDSGIILLQETLIDQDGKVNGGGGGQMFFSHGSSNSRWVATLFPPNLDYKILEKYSYINGRFLLLKCKCEEAIYIIVNCYAPTQQFKKDQIDFINFIKSHINNFDTENKYYYGRGF